MSILVATRRCSGRLVVALAAVVAGALILGIGLSPASAHEPGTSVVTVDLGDEEVEAELLLPLDRLEEATGLALTDDPSAVRSTSGQAVQAYLADHMSATSVAAGSSDAGDAFKEWSVSVGVVSVVQVDGMDHLETTVTLSPPDGVVDDFVLGYDAITAEVETHEVVVVVIGEHATSLSGTLDAATTTMVITTGEVDTGFVDVIGLGFAHVLEGVDHLLFLVVLLLPAPLVITASKRSDSKHRASRHWGSRHRASRHRASKHWAPGRSVAGTTLQIVAVATAFTVGHSVTLALSTLDVVSAPAGPVELLIAASIAVGAVNAIRPLVRGGEAMIAGGFGLVHGLAFAEILDTLALDAGSTALTLLGFNLGVEAAQLLTIALVVPSLQVMAKTRYYPVLRIGGGVVALVAALGWIVERTGVGQNPLSAVEELVIEHPLVVVIALAVAAAVSFGVEAVAASRDVAAVHELDVVVGQDLDEVLGQGPARVDMADPVIGDAAVTTVGS